MRTRPRSVLCLLMFIVAGSALVAHVPPAGAAACDDRFTGKTVTWIVPSAAGGGYDTYSRLIAPFYEKYTGARVVVQNRPGAGGRTGATRILEAAPDGLTVGILNGPGLIMAAMFEPEITPDPATDFTILGRVATNRRVLAVGADSSLPDLPTMLQRGQPRRIVFGTRGPGTASFVSIVLASRILGLEVDIVTGFRGSRDGILGVLRGDVDALAHSYSSLAPAFDSGELEPFLLVSDGPLGDDMHLEGVPWLAGPDGIAVRAAALAGGDGERAADEAEALVELTGAGRLVAAPPGLDEEIAKCMRDALHDALSDEAFVRNAAEAGRPLDVARGDEAAKRLQRIQPQVAGFVPVLRRANEKYGK